MVDQWTGEWTEEKDYSTYPKEKWCDCDYMAVWIREQGYKPKTSMSNLLASIFAHYDCEIEDEDSSYRIDNGNFDSEIEAIQAYVADTGLSEFDYEAQIGVMKMTITQTRVKQYNSTYKTVIAIDGVPVCITRSNKRASDIVSYLSGYEVEINDGKLKKQLDKIRVGK